MNGCRYSQGRQQGACVFVTCLQILRGLLGVARFKGQEYWAFQIRRKKVYHEQIRSDWLVAPVKDPTAWSHCL